MKGDMFNVEAKQFLPAPPELKSKRTASINQIFLIVS